MRVLPAKPLPIPIATLAMVLALALAGVAAAAEPPEPAADLGAVDDLLLTLDREYRLEAVYDRAIRDLGAGGPFPAARREHRRRLVTLARQYESRGLTLPANPWNDRLRPFRDLSEACLVGFRGELALETLYGELGKEPAATELGVFHRDAIRARAPWVEGLRDCALGGGTLRADAAQPAGGSQPAQRATGKGG